MNKRRSFFIMVSFFALLLFNSCGMDKQILELADNIKKGLDSAVKTVAEHEASYAKISKTDAFKAYLMYAEREKWSDKFKEAKDEVGHANNVWRTVVAPMLDRNKKDESAEFLKQLTRVKKSYMAATAKAVWVKKRIAQIDEYKKNVAKLLADARQSEKNITAIVVSLADFRDKSMADYKKRSEDISAKFAPFAIRHRKAKEALVLVEAEFKKHSAKQVADYAVFGDKTKSILETERWAKKSGPEYRSTIGELYNSYTKILLDMREKHKPWIYLVKYEWSESSDFDTTSITSRDKRFVSQADYDKWSKQLERYSDGVRVQSGYGYEVLLEDADIDSSYFHKYIIVQNGKKTETDWVEVDEDEYEDYADNLGMEIVSKPEGYFEEEVNEEPSPPGMGMVGNEKHGEWRKDPATGKSFWHYYGQYAFINSMLGGNRIWYDDYGRWNSGYRGRSPYYGATRTGTAAWGTQGSAVRKSSRFSNTNFAKSGGLRSAPASVRNNNRRGGGPGGKGK